MRRGIVTKAPNDLPMLVSPAVILFHEAVLIVSR